MAYSNKTEKIHVTVFVKTLRKIGKALANSFPYNPIRVLGLKLCGFKVGQNVYVGGGLIVASLISENSCSLTIKNRVAIGPRVTLILSSDANWSNLTRVIKPIKGSITLEDDCWIGAGAIIMPNITVGSSSIIGAGAVVTKDVPPFTIVAGVPARKIKTVDKK